MEKVPAHVHPGPIVPDVLTRQHEHRSRLIWSGDHETCFNNLQCRHFGRNLFQSYGTAPRRLILREFTGSKTDDDLILRARGFIFLLLGGHMFPDFSGSLVHVRYISFLEDFEAISTYSWGNCKLSNPRVDYIRWYRDITRVYIGNPANHDIRTVGYQPAGVDRWMMTSMLQEIDDMASGMIQRPPSSPSQIASFAKKVQTINRKYMVSIGGGTLGCTPSQYDIQQIFPVQQSRRRPREPVPDRGARGVKKGARRLPGGGTRGDGAPVPPDMGRGGDADPGRGGERGERSRTRGRGNLGSSDHGDLFDNPDHSQPSFSLGLTPPTQSHPPTSYTSLFQAPPPPNTIGSSTPYMPISTASSSKTDEHDDQRTDVVTPAQQLGFGHHVGKKTTRFTPSDWP
ncbi:hypothetical protein M9H77_03556 [Catharanthus roseus]|uniref:Uncharacterized protein n=1 Tax=Catharanthus roseus TaxID=4058 RepID=A0ACC0CBH4_CATRO|nr:hypothetical protein M9H77_03556 [Catharanthus roseus]